MGSCIADSERSRAQRERWRRWREEEDVWTHQDGFPETLLLDWIELSTRIVVSIGCRRESVEMFKSIRRNRSTLRLRIGVMRKTKARLGIRETCCV